MFDEGVRRSPSSADLLLTAACVVWGTNFVVVKSALEDFEPLAFNGLRFAGAAAILLALQWRTEGLRSVARLLPRVVAIGLVGNVAYQLLFIYGLAGTQASQAGLFTSTTPLWVLLIAKLTGHDVFNKRVVAGLVIGTTGVTLLLWESFYGAASGGGYGTGNLLLLGASASWAVYTVFSQPLLSQIRPLELTAAAMTAGAVPLLGIAIPAILRIRVVDVRMASWAGLVYSMLMALVFGYWAWSRGVREIGSTRTAIYVNLIPVVATITAWVWLGERLSPLQLLGAVAVVAGIAMSRRLSRPDQ